MDGRSGTPLSEGMHFCYIGSLIHTRRVLWKIYSALCRYKLYFKCSRMNKLLFYIIVLLVPLAGHAQVFKLRAVEFVVTRYKGKDVKPPFRQELDNYPMTLNSDSGTFSIKGPKEHLYTVKNDPSGYKETDSTVTVRFTAVDWQGKNCYVVVVLAKLESAKHDGFVVIAYPDENYLYYFERDKPTAP